MKVVDEKGKLFGKLNIIDLLAILVLVAALAFGGYKLLTRNSGADEATTATGSAQLTYTARVSGIVPEAYEEVLRQLDMAGGRDQLMANGKLVDGAYITAVEAAPHVNYLYDSQGQVVVSEDSGPDARLDLTFTIQAAGIDPLTSLVGTQEVRVGKTHIVKTTHLEFNGTILTCDWN